uniref:Retrovirus-related Pol polyprotein from transposon TNT 1-94 n=1 Tax=Tanacetum cinerariifolium TaxID=118510 RepID=A0A6L2NIB6_TANCI|nr:retrovirus-related Pol polyprotein from transposon TNT 1-94 [Tanacetum cinerariifolium]
MSTDKESSAAGTDNRPPMLVESDYESWKIHIERYIRVIEGQGAAAVQVTRDKTNEEFTEIENNRELADIQATNILSQGLPRHIFNILNQTRTRKEIWDNVELLMKSSGKSLQQKKEEIFDEYEQFCAIGNESIHDYFVHFHKMINDMKITQIDIHSHQMNTKFVNNLPSYWAKYVTNVKNNKDIPATTYVELYTYFKSYEPHALKTLKKQEQSLSIVTDNKEKLVICYNCRGEGHVSRQCKEKKRVKDSHYFKDKMLLMEAKEKGVVLDAEVEAFLADVECTAPYDQPLAITTTNIFEVSHKDAYDYDVDEGPHAAVAFMANLSSTSGTNGATTSHVNKVHTDDNQIFNNVNHLLVHEMHQEEHIDSNVESDINDNTISYHQYQLDSEVQDVPTEVSSVSPGEICMITILDDLRNQLDGHLTAKIAQPTLYDGHALLKPTNTPVRVYDSEVSLVQAEVYWLPAEELATQKSNPPKPVTPFVHTRPTPSKAFTEQVIPFYEHVKELVQRLDENLVKEVTEFMRIFDELDKKYEQCVLEKKKLQIEKKNILIKNECLITDCIEKDICSIVLASDRDRPFSEELRSNCVRENSKVIELEAEILKQQQMLAESDKRWKDDTIRKLQTQINNMSMLNVEPTVNDGFKVENVNLKRCYQELSTSNSHSHDTLTRKLTALTAENAKLKSESHSKMHSEPIVPKKPKVLAPGMYAISSKYIVQPQRVNRAEPTPLPKKKQATFQEPPRPSNRPTQKTVVPQNKKPNIHVNMSIGVKPTTGASKPMYKSDTQNHSTLSAKREKARRVEDHHRNLNKQNHVDSRLNVKRTGFVSNSITVCNACNESLAFANHDNCVVVQIVLWYLDSGCSGHMTGDRSKLTNYVDKFIGTVRFRNDQFAVIVGYGNYKLGNTIISRVNQ